MMARVDPKRFADRARALIPPTGLGAGSLLTKSLTASSSAS